MHRATSAPELLRSMICLSSCEVPMLAEVCDCNGFNNLRQGACFANTATSKPKCFMVARSGCDRQEQRDLVRSRVEAFLQRQSKRGDSINLFSCDFF